MYEHCTLFLERAKANHSVTISIRKMEIVRETVWIKWSPYFKRVFIIFRLDAKVSRSEFPRKRG